MLSFIQNRQSLKLQKKQGLATDDVETKIQLPDDILFDYDKSDLKPHAQSTLNELLQSLETFEGRHKIQINGHTDNTGDEQYNKTLSGKRANR